MKRQFKYLSVLAMVSAFVLSLTSCVQNNNKKSNNTTTNIPSTTVPSTTVPSATNTPSTTVPTAPSTTVTEERIFYVTPNAATTGAGTKDNPISFVGAYSKAQAGDTILMADGVYEYTYRLELQNSGYAGKYITVRPETDDDRVIFDFSKMIFDGTNRGIQIYGDFWYFYDIEVTGAGDNGMYIAGSHNVVDNCIFYNNRDSGLQLGRGYSDEIKLDQWPSYNLIKNCTAFANYDDQTFGENADGFAAKLTVGYGNVFDGCIAFRNSDDGWDLYAKEDSGNIGTVVLYNCVSFENGYLPYQITKENADGTTEQTYDTLSGDGIGFKLGGSVMEGDVLVENCLAFNNKLHGFGDNSNPGTIMVKNITAFNNCAGLNAEGKISGMRGLPDLTNKSNNIDLARDSKSYNSYYGVLSYINNQNGYEPFGDSSYNTDAFKGSVSYSIFNTSYNEGEEYVAFTGVEDASSHHSATEDIAFSGGSLYEGLSDDSFVNLDPINAVCESNKNFDTLIQLHYDLRNEDQSVNMGDTLSLKDEELLTFANGKPIGAVLNKTSGLDYTHPQFFTFVDANPEMSADELSVLSAYFVCDPVTLLDATYQDFDVPKLIQGCEITWKSSNEDVITIDNNEQSSISVSVFSKAKVIVPLEETIVKLTATISCGNASVEKEFNIVVKSRNQELGELTSTGEKAIRVNLYGTFLKPRIYAIDASSITGSELPTSLYDIEYTYRYASDGNSKYYNVDGIYTSVPGVYEVTAFARSNKNSNITSKFVYNVYVVDPDCDIDFKNGNSTAVLTRDGFEISGSLSNIEGDVIAVVTDTPTTFASATELLNNENVQFVDIETDSITAPFIANNKVIKDADIQYYVSYAVVNKNRSNADKAVIYSFEVNNVEVSTHEQFYSLARTGKISGVEASSTTIFSLTTDLDFANFNWEITKKDTSGTFSGLLNGNDHMISNITIASTSSEDEKTINVFYKVSNATIMNINFDNIKLSNKDYGKLLGVIGDLQGGYLHDIHLTRITCFGKESCGALVGQVTGAYNYITQCSLVNPIPENKIPTYENGDYVISAGNKYAGGIVGNAQRNSDQDDLLISISDCMVLANIGDGKDASGNTGGILGRVKNETVTYTTIVERCYYKGTIVAKGQYNAGIVGDFDNGLGYVKIKNNLSDVEFIYNGLLLNAQTAYDNYETQKYAHKNSNPIVGRAVKAEAGIYETSQNLGSWAEYYSTHIFSSSMVFDLVIENEDGTVIKYELSKVRIEGMLKLDLENTWSFDATTKELRLLNE